MYQFGALGVGVGVGMFAETVKRAVGLSNGKGNAMLSKNNVELIVERLTRMRGAALKLGQMLSIQGISIKYR